MSLTTGVNNLSNLVALGYADLNANDRPANQRFRPGELGFFVDDYGMRYFKYIKNLAAADVAMGDVVQRIADVTFTDPDSTTTTSITKASAFTADAHIGKVLIYETNASAGAAPEGQSAIIWRNTASVLYLDQGYPFSAAPGFASSDAYRIWGPWHADAAGAAVLAENVLGVCVGNQGITVGNYGWVQFQGVFPLTKVTAAAIVAGVAVVTGATGKVATIGAAAANKVVGYSVGTVNATNSGYAAVMWTLGAVGGVSL